MNRQRMAIAATATLLLVCVFLLFVNIWLKEFCITLYETTAPALVIADCNDIESKPIAPKPRFNVVLPPDLNVCLAGYDFENTIYFVRKQEKPLLMVGLGMIASGEPDFSQESTLRHGTPKLQKFHIDNKRVYELVSAGKIVLREVRFSESMRSGKEMMLMTKTLSDEEGELAISLAVIDTISPSYLCDLSCSMNGVCCMLTRIHSLLRI